MVTLCRVESLRPGKTILGSLSLSLSKNWIRERRQQLDDASGASVPQETPASQLVSLSLSLSLRVCVSRLARFKEKETSLLSWSEKRKREREAQDLSEEMENLGHDSVRFETRGTSVLSRSERESE